MGRRRTALTLVVIVLSLASGATARAVTGADRLEGMVVNSGGAPAGGVIVSLSGRGVRREALTNDGGGFQIEPLTPGVYLLSATAGSIASEEVRVEIHEGEAPPHVTLTLKPLFASTPIAGRLEVLLAGGNLLNDRFETGRAPVVTLGAPRATAGVRPFWTQVA
jgi:hypothetical protein